MATNIHSGTPPFGLGKTWYDGNTIDTADYGNTVDLEGRVHTFDNTDPAGAPLRRAGTLKCICVRNVSGITLLPKRLVVYKAGFTEKRVDGYCRLFAGDYAGLIDDHLPAGGVPNGDLFWLIIDGQALCKTNQAADVTNNFSARSILVAATAANSTATTLAGLVGVHTYANTQDILANEIFNSVGRALTARTTGETYTDTLVNVRQIY